MFKHLSLSVFLLVIAASSVFAASASKGEKVGKIGDYNNPALKSTGSCDDNANWKELGENFFRKDCFKTGAGGSIILILRNEDNSSITVAENSIVNINELLEKDESGSFRVKVDIQKGYMKFRAEKNKGHEMEFYTGTAAASIRGTEGVIGGDGKKTMFAGLKNGNLAIRDTVSGDSLAIGEGETAIGRDGFAVLALKSSGELGFAKILNSIIADTTLTLENLKVAAEKADKEYQESLAANAASSASENDKDSKTLNIPQIKYSSYDSLRCVANVSVSDVQAESRLSAVMDGTPISEVRIKRNTSKRLALRSGVHEYEFVVENEAGRNSVRKTLGCYPMKPFSVKIFGKQYEPLQIPPAPPIAGLEDVIMETLQFQIRVPENDASFLNKVTVRQNGKVILQERLSQIQNLDYQIPVELKRWVKNRFDIEVIHKSGYTVKTTKVWGE